MKDFYPSMRRLKMLSHLSFYLEDSSKKSLIKMIQGCGGTVILSNPAGKSQLPLATSLITIKVDGDRKFRKADEILESELTQAVFFGFLPKFINPQAASEELFCHHGKYRAVQNRKMKLAENKVESKTPASSTPTNSSVIQSRNVKNFVKAAASLPTRPKIIHCSHFKHFKSRNLDSFDDLSGNSDDHEKPPTNQIAAKIYSEEALNLQNEPNFQSEFFRKRRLQNK
jgi:hypothetical protein